MFLLFLKSPTLDIRTFA